MKALVICPDRPAGFAFLARKRPAALAPMLGPSLLGHALAMLAEAGAKKVIVLAADRPEQIRASLERGERWGLQIEVVAESRDLSVEEARRKYRADDKEPWLPEGSDIVVADRLPTSGGPAPLKNARSWFESLQRAFPEASRHRVGVREISPGILAGLRSRIESGAELQAPCWLGEGTWIRARAKVGPNAFIEDHALIDHDAEVRESWIGPGTYIGAMTHVSRSLAWGHGLLDWESNSFVEVPDAFLLGDLESASPLQIGSSLAGRAFAFLVAVLTSPLALLVWIGGVRTIAREAVVPTGVTTQGSTRQIGYREFTRLAGLWKRWPQLWNIVRGEFSWVGNRPLTCSQAAELTTEFEQLWLAVPIGLFSLADAEGFGEAFDDDSRAHAAFYAAQAGPKMNRQILLRTLRRLCGSAAPSAHNAQPTHENHERLA